MMKRKQFALGMKAGIPVVLGFIPVGIAFGIMARQSGFTVIDAVMMSLLVFAGASQMMAVGMVAQGAGMMAIIFATFILNFRHLIMSVCVMNRVKDERRGLRLLAAFGVTDESFAIFTTEKSENANMPFLLGLIMVTYLSWVTGSLIGALATNILPAIVSLSLGVALYAMFIGLLVPSLKGNVRLILLVVATAIVNWLLGFVLPSGWALIAATLLCAFAGVFFVDFDDKEAGNE